MSFSPLDCSFSVTQINITPEFLEVVLDDGRVIPILRNTFKRLATATDEQLSHWHIDRLGIGIHWEELDEDLLIYPLIEDAERLGTIRHLNAS